MAKVICSPRVAFAAVLAVSVFGSSAWAAPINYGDFSGNTVDFLQVTEDSVTDPLPPALYGTPNVSGDSLDFNPVSFNATASGAGGSDTTVGVLTMMMASRPGHYIDRVRFEEAGEFTVSGLTGNASVSVSATFELDILEVDGVGVVPINLVIPMMFSPSAGDFDLVSDGPGPLVNDIWNGELMVDLSQALIDNNVPFTSGVTKVSVRFDNTLTAQSEAGTSAFIAKKDVGGVGITVVPEPASLALLAAGGFCLLGRQR